MFLALSATMIIAAMLAVRGRTESVQYTDAVRSTQSFYERRQSQILAGSITEESQQCRWNGASYSGGPSDGSCIFLGYLFRMNPSTPGQIDVLQMYGGRLPSSDPCFAANPEDPLFCVSPTPTPVTGSPSPVETFLIPWGMEVYHTWSGSPGAQYMGYLRNPIGQNLIPIGFGPGQEGSLDDPSAYRKTSSATQIGDEFSGIICLETQSKNAVISLGSDEDQFAITADFDQGNIGLCP